MREELRTRTFKSGNSMALRLPSSLGFRPGEEVILVDRGDGTFSFRLAEQQAGTLDALYGSFSDDFMGGGRGEIEQEPRQWDTAADNATRAA